MTLSFLSSEQRDGIEQAMDILRHTFPNTNDNRLVEFLAAQIITLPGFSTLKHALVTTVAATMVGAATLCYGAHPDTGETCIILIRRSDIGPDGQPQYGVVGGFTNPGFYELTANGYIPHAGETPRQGATRENREELIDDKGNPILNIRPEQLVPIDTGSDERSLKSGRLPTSYSGNAVALDADQMRRVVDHSNRLKTDPVYKKAVNEHSEMEVVGVEVMPRQDAAFLPKAKFTHGHELTAIQILNDLLAPEPTNDPRINLIGKALRAKEAVMGG